MQTIHSGHRYLVRLSMRLHWLGKHAFAFVRTNVFNLMDHEHLYLLRDFALALMCTPAPAPKLSGDPACMWQKAAGAMYMWAKSLVFDEEQTKTGEACTI